ncbi:hypothetical protein B224_1391 [Aeromonas media WS]|nr:hypothetical protein B224_1391 [Aeromonas media WS]
MTINIISATHYSPQIEDIKLSRQKYLYRGRPKIFLTMSEDYSR